MTNNVPKIFIGSASESLDVAQALEFDLSSKAKTELWETSFRPGHYTLEELTRKASEVDFAAFILGQEDKTESRGDVSISPRDNVVYEAGLFAGYLGVANVFLVIAKGTKIPTDWKGIGYISYDPSEEDATEAVRSAGIAIRKQFSKWTKNANSLEQQILGSYCQFVVSQDHSSVVSLFEIKLHPTEGLQVSGDAWTSEGKSIATYHSRTASLDVSKRTLVYYWVGEHPRDESLPSFFGIGEVVFDKAVDGVINNARGYFSTSDSHKLQETQVKTTVFRRATEAEVKLARDPDIETRKKLIYALLEERKKLLND